MVDLTTMDLLCLKLVCLEPLLNTHTHSELKCYTLAQVSVFLEVRESYWKCVKVAMVSMHKKAVASHSCICSQQNWLLLPAVLVCMPLVHTGMVTLFLSTGLKVAHTLIVEAADASVISFCNELT